MTIAEKQAEIIAEFEKLSDWEARYQKIIERGKAMPDLAEQYKLEKNKVKGCQSTVWLHAELEGDRVKFLGDSDAMIVRGLVALVLYVYSGETPATILATPPDFIAKTGLGSHLSQTRANGLAAMIKQIKNYAIAFDFLLKKKGVLHRRHMKPKLETIWLCRDLDVMGVEWSLISVTRKFSQNSSTTRFCTLHRCAALTVRNNLVLGALVPLYTMGDQGRCVTGILPRILEAFADIKRDPGLDPGTDYGQAATTPDVLLARE